MVLGRCVWDRAQGLLSVMLRWDTNQLLTFTRPFIWWLWWRSSGAWHMRKPYLGRTHLQIPPTEAGTLNTKMAKGKSEHTQDRGFKAWEETAHTLKERQNVASYTERSELTAHMGEDLVVPEQRWQHLKLNLSQMYCDRCTHLTGTRINSLIGRTIKLGLRNGPRPAKLRCQNFPGSRRLREMGIWAVQPCALHHIHRETPFTNSSKYIHEGHWHLKTICWLSS